MSVFPFQSPHRCRRRERGVTLPEMLVVLAVLGIVGALSVVGWQDTRRRIAARSSAQLTKMLLHQARMSAIYHRTNYFFLLDPDNKRVEIYADRGTVAGSFDDADAWTAGTHLDDTIELALPLSPIGIPSPLDSSTVSDAWSMPDPDSSARWGADLKGLMITPTGLIQSAEASPQTIGRGVIVFSNRGTQTAAVGIRGRAGSVTSYELVDSGWRER